MNKLKSKKVIAAVAAASLAMSMQAISAFALGAKGITIKLDDVATAVNYKVYGYYFIDGDYKAVEAQNQGNGKYYFPAPITDEMTAFYYDLYTADGACVASKSMGYVGNLAYEPEEYVVPVEAPVTYDDVMLAYGMTNNNGSSESTVQDAIPYENQDNSSLYVSEDTGSEDFIDSSSGGIDTPMPIVSNSNGSQVKSGVGVTVNNATGSDISIIMPSHGFTVYLTGEDGNTLAYVTDGLLSQFQLVSDLAQGVYNVQYLASDDAYSVVTGTSQITVEAGKAAMLDVKVSPTCTLSVIDSKNNSTDFYFYGTDRIYNTASNNLIGVVAGETYTIVSKRDSTAFDITIPANTTECVLDLGAVDGVPINDKAYSDAVLDNTASIDNPYNIPITSDEGKVYNNNFAIMIASVISCILAFVAKITKKKNDD